MEEKRYNTSYNLKHAVYGLAAAAVFCVIVHLEIGIFQLKPLAYAFMLASLPFVAPVITAKIHRYFRGILMAASILVSFFSVLFFLLGLGLCAYSDRGTEYISKNGGSTKIVARGYSCFMTDEDRYLYKMTPILGAIHWITPVSENEIDTAKWQRTYE